MISRIWLFSLLLLMALWSGCQASTPTPPSFDAIIAPIPGVRLALDENCPQNFRPANVGEVHRAHWDGQDIWLCATEETLRTADNGQDFMPWMQAAQALLFHVNGNEIWFAPAQAGDKTIQVTDENGNCCVNKVVPGTDLMAFVLDHHLSPWLDASQLAELWKKQGDKLRSNRRFSEAIEAYQKAVALNPDFADAYVGLGAAQLGLGETEQALDSLLRATALAPDDFWAQRLLGNAYLHLHRYELAVAPLTRAYELNPDDPQILIGVALALGRSGQREQALQVLDKAASQISDSKQLDDIRALSEEFSGRGD